MTDTEDQQIPPGRKRRELNRQTLDSLLAALSADRDEAAAKYESLRRRLIDLFAWEQCDAPEDLADEALNRLAWKVNEGTPIPHPDRYAFGIARLMIQEEARKQRKRESVVRELESPGAHSSGRDSSMLAAIEKCLAALPPENRELIERYYAEDRSTLALSFGISVNALRNRALRIREQIFNSVVRERDNS
ncbi:MAG TPA: sigma-70 family RNA polymerase sigma factor [Bryobacteraceae bacterium]|nr:sigma-70 family RNA polymerase sigma factor [Bryobacteraceae bacterium]